MNAVYFWALQYGEVVEVLLPESLRRKIGEGAANIFEKYKEKRLDEPSLSKNCNRSTHTGGFD